MHNHNVPYNIFPINVYQSQEVYVQPHCNGWTAINLGPDIVQVEGITLLPPPGAGLAGQSVSIGGNIGEVYGRTTIRVTFQTTTAPNVLIIQKIYMK